MICSLDRELLTVVVSLTSCLVSDLSTVKSGLSAVSVCFALGNRNTKASRIRPRVSQFYGKELGGFLQKREFTVESLGRLGHLED